MASNMKNRVRTAMKGKSARGFNTTDAGRGKRKGEQGRGKPGAPGYGYSNGKRKKAVGVNHIKKVYAKRVSTDR